MMAFESSGHLWLAPGNPEPLSVPQTVQDLWGLAMLGVFDVWLSPATISTIRRQYAGQLPDRPFVHDLEATSWPIHRPHEPLTAKPFLALEATLAALKCRAAGPTPAWRGLSLLKRWRDKHPDRFAIESDGEVPQDAAPNITRRLLFEKQTRYVHKLDMNAAYPAAAKDCPLGAGHLLPAPSLVWQPGIWRVTIGQSINGWQPIPADGWYDTSALRVAHQYGQAFTLEEGYFWSSYSTPLRGWCESLLNALKAVPDSKPYVKAVYTRTMGKIGSRAGTNAIWYRHPHWWRAIISAANLRVWWLAQKCPEICGIATDSILVVTTGTPELPAEIRARISDSPGRYRHEWTKHLAPPVARLFGEVPATVMLDELKRYPTLEKRGVA